MANKTYIESGIYLIKKNEIVALEKQPNEYKIYLRGGHLLETSLDVGEQLWNECVENDHSGESD